MKSLGILLGSLLSGCTLQHTFVHQNEQREYLLYKPLFLPKDAPLVFMMHGYRGTARLYRVITGINKVARKNGFAVVYPQGTKNPEGIPYWNAQLLFTNVDDVGYLTDLAQFLQETHGFDSSRTYATGISNGGFMSYTLGCQKPDVFKGVASLIGTMSGETWRTCQPLQPVPILQITGAVDTTVPMDGSMSLDNGWGGAPHIHDVMAFWAENNGCLEKQEMKFIENTNATYYTQCQSGAEVWYYQVEDMGHTLPSTKKEGWNAMEKIWQFFERD